MPDQEFLSLLACPVCRGPLALAPDKLVAELNGRIRLARLENVSGVPVKEPLDGALLCRNDRRAYPIHSSIPLMLESEAIPLIEY